MRIGRMLPALALLLLPARAAESGLHIYPAKILLQGADAGQQLLLLAPGQDGDQRDWTTQAAWTVDNPALAAVSPAGRITAKGNGQVMVTATSPAGSATAAVQILAVEQSRPFSFARDIGSILTRKGCNGAACHGGVKGRGGLKLSAGSLLPADDYEWITKGGEYKVLTVEVKGDRVPRVDLKDPEKSLLLQKPTGQIPHGGGRRFTIDSSEYKTLLAWIRNGAPFGQADTRDRRVDRLEVFPPLSRLAPGEQRRLLVTAHFADGHTEDFSDQALFVSNDRDIAPVTEAGIVKGAKLGETAILVRAAGLASSAAIGVTGPNIADYPEVPRNNFIDQFIFDKLRRFHIVPSQLSSDSEFIRRVCLDLAGTLPPPAQVQAFVQSRDPKKREHLVDALMNTPEFVDFWTYRFDDIFRVAVFANGIRPKWSAMYADWVRQSVATNKPYDRMARERLTASGYDGPSRHFLPYDVIGPPGETMAEEVRVLFGRRLDCAQCHNHPYEAWTQDQFWGMAAFFGRLFKMGDQGDEYVLFDHPMGEGMGNSDVNGSIKLLHPRTKAELKPVLLDGTAVNAGDRQNPRQELADWMVRHPYFAEAAVNRFWSYFFGRGLVDPVDDFRSTNPPTHPELLAKLAEDFRQNKHDVRRLIRTIVLSRTYQLSAAANETNAADRTNYSHAQPRPLDAEVLLDAISNVTGVAEPFTAGAAMTQTTARAPVGTRAIQLREPDLFYSRFLDLYGRPNRLSVPERNAKANLGQALHMLAGSVYNEKLADPAGRLEKAIQAGRTDAEIIQETYLAAYSRPPSSDELKDLNALIAQQPERKAALRDFVWAVLSSREFAENH